MSEHDPTPPAYQAPRVAAVTRVTAVTRGATTLTLMVIAGTAGFLVGRFPRLPPRLPVHLDRAGFPDRWAAKSYPLVLMPVFIQLALAAVFGAVAVLLLRRASRPAPPDPTGPPDPLGDDARMRAAGEALALLACIWIAFQGLAAIRIVRLWESGGGTLGSVYAVGLAAAVLGSVAVGGRAVIALQRTPASPAGEERVWRLRVLYVNPRDPALFAPMRDGRGYTLNFGRRAAVLWLAAILLAGLALPVLIVRLLTR